MDQHVIDAELAAGSQLLDSASIAHLAYLAENGTPRVVPVGFFWTGEQFIISTASTAPKVAALVARSDVALTVDFGDTPASAQALSVRGRADIRIVDGVVEEYLAAACKSLDPDAAARFEQDCRAMYDRMARIAVTPSWARYYDFSAGRMPTFLQELAHRSTT